MPADGSAAPKRRKMPAQRPGRSIQEVATPLEFIDALEERFGKLTFDLCATDDNCVVRNHDGSRSKCFFSPEEDGLRQEWSHLGGNLWCNPPFGRIEPWAEKAAEEANTESRVFLLTPASIGSHWWWKHIRPHAVVYVLQPRIAFTGASFPKDLQVAVFGLGAQGLGRWRWTKEIAKR